MNNLLYAFWRAARGKRTRPAVCAFEARLDSELTALRRAILTEVVSVGSMRSFRVFDPKPRIIHAPCFRERVLHHALMRHVGPVLDRSLVDDTYACRTGRGSLNAVRRAQAHARRFPWYVKIDVRRFFASVSHEVLIAVLTRRFKGPGLLRLCARIIHSHETSRGRGLPIGALTSQSFANAYLGDLDRFLLEGLKVPGMVRYMDDVVWWTRTRDEAKRSRDAVMDWTPRTLRLELHDNAPIQRSTAGLSFLGFRVFPNHLGLSRRRRSRYRRARRRWETAYRLGLIDARQLQSGVGAALAVTAHADVVAWRRRELTPTELCDI